MVDPALLTAKFNSCVGDTRLSIASDHLKRLLDCSCLDSEAPSAPTAHAFASWVYHLEHTRYEGVGRNRSFLSRARKKVSDILDRLVDGRIDSWELMSCDTGSRDDKVYESSVLHVADRPLRLKPDAVFRDSQTGLIVIFEYKIPSLGVSIPLQGWPNLVAQLWSYAWADEWANNPHVLLVGAMFKCVAKEVVLGDIWPRTIKADPALNQGCVNLFHAWGGNISPQVVGDANLRRFLLT